MELFTKRIVFIIWIAAVLVGFGHFAVKADRDDLFSVPSQAFAWDFAINWTAAQAIKEDLSRYNRPELHQLAKNYIDDERTKYLFSSTFTSYIGPPLTSVLMYPWSPFSFSRAVVSYRWFSFYVFILSAIILALYSTRPARTLGIGLVFIFVCNAPYFSLRLGQVDSFVIFGLTLTLIGLRTRSYFVTGFGTAFATIVKISPGLLILYFIFCRKHREAAVAVLFCLMFLVLPAFFGQSGDLFDWIKTAQKELAAGTSELQNQSMPAYLSRVFGTDALLQPYNYAPLFPVFKWLAYILALGSTALVGLKVKQTSQFALGAAVIILLGILLAPISWDHYFSWALVSVLVFADYRYWFNCRRTVIAVGSVLALAGLALSIAPDPGQLVDMTSNHRLKALVSGPITIALVLLLSLGFLLVGYGRPLHSDCEGTTFYRQRIIDFVVTCRNCLLNRSFWIRHVGIVFFLLILLIAAALRIPNSDYGLPYEYGWDEPEIMLPALRILREGVYIPYKFDYGPLNGYLHAGWGVLSFVRGLGDGHFPDGIWGVQTDNATGWYWTVSSPWLLQQARVLCALLGLASIAFVYAAALKLWSNRLAALWSAAVLAFNATFVNQTSFVTADATTIFAACICIWSSVHIYTSRERWAYVTAAISAAATMAFKYNNVVIVVLPLVAHYAGSRQSVETNSRWIPQIRYVLWFAVAAVIFMFPVFLRPVRFLNDVGTLLGYYVAPEDSSIFTVLRGFAQRGLSLLDMGTVSVPGKALKTADQIKFNIAWYGLGVVVTVLGGIVFSAINNPRIFCLLMSVVALNFVNVGGDTGFFYSRYLLLSLPFLSLLGGYFVYFVANHQRMAALPKYFIPIFLAVSLSPYLYHPIKTVSEMEATIDPREKMAGWMKDNVPPGKRILILEETRWDITPEQARNWQITKATVPQLLQSPMTLSTKDFLIAPRAVYFHSPTPELGNLATEINKWLGTLRSEIRFGQAPIAFNGPDVNPAVQFVEVSSLPPMKADIPKNKVSGVSFASPNAGNAMLGNGVLTIRSGAIVNARLHVTSDSSTLVVRAQGTSPYEQEIPARLDVTLSPEQSGSEQLPTQTLTLGRSQSGIHDYRASLQVPSGDYRVSIRAQDNDNYLTRLESVSVEP